MTFALTDERRVVRGTVQWSTAGTGYTPMLDEPTLVKEREAVAEGAAIGTAGTSGLQTRPLLRVIFVILAVAVALWALYALKAVLLLVVLAMFFGYLIAPLAVTLGSIVLVRYTLKPLVECSGWRIVEASPQERAVLAAHGIKVEER